MDIPTTYSEVLNIRVCTERISSVGHLTNGWVSRSSVVVYLHSVDLVHLVRQVIAFKIYIYLYISFDSFVCLIEEI